MTEPGTLPNTVPAIEVELAQRHCERITRREARNFYWGIRLLPQDKRLAMCSVYAFARMIDDIADSRDCGKRERLDALAAARASVQALEEPLGSREQRDPVMIALGNARERFGLPSDALELLIDGVEMDVIGTRYETFEELVGYCRRVAGTIGRLCLAVYTGSEPPRAGADELADDLGVAMQLTNILRDIREDRELGRTYLPAQDLRRFGLPDPAPGGAPNTDSEWPEDRRAAAALVELEASRAADWFDRGLELTKLLDTRSAACVLAMSGIYRALLQRIQEDPGRVLRERVALPATAKAWVATRSLLAAARPSLHAGANR